MTPAADDGRVLGHELDGRLRSNLSGESAIDSGAGTSGGALASKPVRFRTRLHDGAGRPRQGTPLRGCLRQGLTALP